jgi:putative spermidine/putrescine transport system substrate-binding protein
MKRILFTASAIAVLTAANAMAADKTLTTVSWGGAYSKSQLKAYDEPFEKKFGVKILHEDKSNDALAGIRAQEEAGNVTWNVVDMLQADAQRACGEGLIEKIDFDKWLAPAPDGTPASKDFIKGTTGDCFVPQILYDTLFAYNKTAFPNGGPKTIADIWDLKKFPGMRALEKIPQKNLEWALIADGVPVDQVYKVLATKAGQDRAFKKLDEIKDHVIWWSAGAQPPQLLADKEAVISTAYNGRIFNAQVNEKQPFEIMWDGAMFETDGWVVPAKQSKDKLDLVKEYLKFATDTQRLADQAKYISYGPARYSSAPLVGKFEGTDIEMKPNMPTSPENLKHSIRFNVEFWADYGDALEERFNAWVAGG